MQGQRTGCRSCKRALLPLQTVTRRGELGLGTRGQRCVLEWGEGRQLTPDGKETHLRKMSRTTVRQCLPADGGPVALKANAN